MGDGQLDPHDAGVDRRDPHHDALFGGDRVDLFDLGSFAEARTRNDRHPRTRQSVAFVAKRYGQFPPGKAMRAAEPETADQEPKAEYQRRAS
ncbi:hypothetical protein R1A27_32315 (plasmid) [Methylobacterium sp. NMS12]|uniref:hypothetical protein n=1 Tax=Methylobacterium sp. NMS12 TaxID=3079766 RepID=UPI003F885BB2